ncbi:hypothetical protein [Klebsiella pneumoniae]|nr:hypothetical protein [Klebsiella pneumoniae]
MRSFTIMSLLETFLTASQGATILFTYRKLKNQSIPLSTPYAT